MKAFLQFKIYILVGSDTLAIVIVIGNPVKEIDFFHVMYGNLETSSDYDF